MKNEISSDIDGTDKQNQLWVRVMGTKLEPLRATAIACGAEVIRSSLRRIDANHIIIDMLIPGKTLDGLKKKFPVEVLGNMEKMTLTNARFVSGTDRYRK